ncbi:hypothetical protein CW362_30270 [Streptomyces populi]|uniref:Uncharacterized protein n=1 Tax=Streptomyces populi TaxID=2058924 RepID=A0A2I0SHC2_9ACTN|nr:hypothetical protein CW362_30270 [Streptomyces populi]
MAVGQRRVQGLAVGGEDQVDDCPESAHGADEGTGVAGGHDPPVPPVADEDPPQGGVDGRPAGCADDRGPDRGGGHGRDGDQGRRAERGAGRSPWTHASVPERHSTGPRDPPFTAA